MEPSHIVRIAGGLRRAVGIATLALVLLGVAPAGANEFTINACQADRSEFSTRAFEDFANRGMLWRRACNPEGPGLRGLVTANVVRSGRVVQGSRSYFVMRAPEGTQFARFTWSGQARRHDCRYALQLWADRPDGSSVAIKNVRANRGCPNQGKTQAAGWPRPETYDIAGATKVVQRVLCVGSDETPYCSARNLNYIRTFTAAATVVDTSPPGVAITQDNAFTRGEWVGGTQQVNYGALDNVGVRLARAVVAGIPSANAARPCNYALRVPCVNGPGSLTVDTGSLGEGSQVMALQAEDAAGNVGGSPPVSVRIDNTAPGAVPISIEGGATWRNRNDFDIRWINPDEGDRAPIAASQFRLCAMGRSDCITDRRPGAVDHLNNMTVPGPGEWDLRVWREDAAGNHEPANASVPVTLRYDPEPPDLGFEDPSASDPTLISVLVTDKVSGLASGQIELSAEGSGTWQSLSTRQEGNRLIARVDDAALPPGPYVLRATAHDRATNQNSTQSRLDGRPMTVNLPLRSPTRVHAGVVARRSKHRARGRRRQTFLDQRIRISLGHEIRLAGVVKTHDGRPLAYAPVHVLYRTTNSPERELAVLRTDLRGRFAYVSRASASAVLRVAYQGSGTTLPSQREVTLLVPAGSTVHAQPRRVLNGRTVTFTGQVRSLPIPAGGKLVELQVVLSGRWQTFRTVRTDASGAWGIRYRFRRSCGVLSYRFRTRLPAEAGYPFESGHTRAVSVRVRGRPCR
jgi:hypothetical protein